MSFLQQEDTTAVVQRQEKILKQLEDLKAQLGKIRASLSGPVPICGKTVQHTTAYQNGGLKEVSLSLGVVSFESVK